MLLLSSFSIKAQKNISGYIYEYPDSVAIENVLCRLISSKNSSLNEFSFSDENGKFYIQALDKDNDSVRFSLLGYQEQTIPVSVLLKNHVVILKPAENILREVIVTAPHIREKGDTLVYNINKFISQNDKYIADILKKLPGITVNRNGSINYQGEAINKFYIEGRDLLGGNYSLASNNLNVDAVGTVEIIEHNQHIRSLNGVEQSNRAAINIKLKNKYLVKPFGEVNLGYGTKSIYNGNITASFLSKKTQAIACVKTNNTGENIISDLDNKLDVNSILTYIPPYENVLNNVSFQTPPLPINRYRFNKTTVVSGNLLVPVSASSELKLNVVYGLDKDYPTYSIKRSLMLGDDKILSLFENTNGKSSVNKLKASATYEINSSSLYLKDEVEFMSCDNTTKAAMLTNTDSIESKTGISPLNFENRLNLIYRTKSDQIVSFQSSIHLCTADEYMSNLYQALQDSIQTTYENKKIVTKNVIGSSFPILNSRLGIQAAFNYSKYNYDTHSKLSPIYINNGFDTIPQSAISNYSKYEFGILPSINFRWFNNAINLTLNGNTWLYSLSKNDLENKKRVAFLPSISSTFKFSHKFEGRIFLNRTFDYIGGINQFDFPFIRSYRSIYIPSSDINYRVGYSSSLNLKFRDILNLIFGNFSVIYKRTKNNYTPYAYNTEEWSITTTSNKESNSSMLRLQADLSKTFSSIKTSITLTPIYTKNITELLQQDIFTNNIYNIYEFNFRLSNNKLNWLYTDCSFNIKLMNNKNKLKTTKPLMDLCSKIDLFFYPLKDLTINIYGELINMKRENRFDNHFFLDSAVSYDFKRLKFKFDVKNILNIRSYTISEFSSVNEYIQNFPLRGREFMLSIGTSF